MHRGLDFCSYHFDKCTNTFVASGDMVSSFSDREIIDHGLHLNMVIFAKKNNNFAIFHEDVRSRLVAVSVYDQRGKLVKQYNNFDQTEGDESQKLDSFEWLDDNHFMFLYADRSVEVFNINTMDSFKVPCEDIISTSFNRETGILELNYENQEYDSIIESLKIKIGVIFSDIYKMRYTGRLSWYRIVGNSSSYQVGDESIVDGVDNSSGSGFGYGEGAIDDGDLENVSGHIRNDRPDEESDDDNITQGPSQRRRLR